MADGRSLVEIAPGIKPEVIVADISMPLMNGLEAGLRVKQTMPNVKLVFLTMYNDLGVRAMRSGASGYLLKTSGAGELSGAIQMALECKCYVTPQIARCMEKSLIENLPTVGPSKVLTARQREVLQLRCSGKTTKEAASILNVSERTVAFHKYRVMCRFNLGSNAELVRFAVSQAIVVVRLP
jgi:DNA-binding NarL/FixJ family response regulator